MRSASSISPPASMMRIRRDGNSFARREASRHPEVPPITQSVRLALNTELGLMLRTPNYDEIKCSTLHVVHVQSRQCHTTSKDQSLLLNTLDHRFMGNLVSVSEKSMLQLGRALNPKILLSKVGGSR